MPTEQEYYDKAAAIRQFAADNQLIERAQNGIQGDLGIKGGIYADALHINLSDQISKRALLTADLDGLEGELTRRAGLCRQYTIDMTDFRQRLESWEQAQKNDMAPRGSLSFTPATPKPTPPRRPFPECEEG